MIIQKNLALSYRKGKAVATTVDEIRLDKTGLTFVVGANGQGKTTLYEVSWVVFSSCVHYRLVRGRLYTCRMNCNFRRILNFTGIVDALF